jgi:leader peptidase (prepilin peptidase)/N-methyltransferase
VEVGLVIALITGVAGGWAVNYLADILPVTRRLSQPTCLHCDKPLSWQDYLLLHRCRACGKSRRVRAWIVHLLFIALNIYFWFAPPPRLGFALGWVLLLYFTTVFVIDLEHRLILHPTSIFGAFLGLGVGLLRQGLQSTLLGGLTGFGFVFLLYLFGVLFTKIRARRMQAAGLEADDEDAFGAGDVILSTILGLMLGWPLTWFGLLFGVLLGGLISGLIMLGLFLSGRYKNQAWMVFIPFGPFFVVSAFLIIYLPKVMVFLVPK